MSSFKKALDVFKTRARTEPLWTFGKLLEEALRNSEILTVGIQDSETYHFKSLRGFRGLYPEQHEFLKALAQRLQGKRVE